MIRDKELENLKKYAEAMGAKVLFSQKRCDNAFAEWYLDGKQITVFEKEHKSKMELVLSLIHEIAHHCEFVRNNNREFDEKLDEALSDEEEKKRHRKKIYDFEVKGTQHWESIYRDTDCKFPIYKLYVQRDFDIFQYEVYYETGQFPSKKERDKKYKELKEKYKK
jgi:hypothetical protein